jgi:predicted acetylornithine/succinylornithine family transaminase
MTSSAPAPAAPAAPAADESAILGTYKRAPMQIVRGKGVFLYDDDGRAYLDFTSGIAVSALGYDDPGVNAALQEAMATGVLHTSNLFRTPDGEALAARLTALSGFAAKAFFCNSGAEANEGAFKFARKWARAIGGPAKHEIIALRGSFHGRLFGTVAATDRPAYRLPFTPLVPGVRICERDLAELEQVVSADTTAAVIVEPIQGEGGVRVMDAGLLRELRRLTQERRVALILDEIQCGLGRTGALFAYEHAGIHPDMVTLAKPIANGLPMGAVLCSAEIAAAMAPGDHGTTFGGGPFVAHVARHVLERLAAPAMLAHVRDMAAFFREALAALQARTGAIRAIRGMGMMWGLDVHEPVARLVERARGEGLLLVGAGEHTLRLLPPLVMTRDEAQDGLARLERVLLGG